MQPSVSVIIPCHNGARYLEGLADSLRRLLTPEVEVIFVDDGSTDGSGDLFQNLLPSARCCIWTVRSRTTSGRQW